MENAGATSPAASVGCFTQPVPRATSEAIEDRMERAFMVGAEHIPHPHRWRYPCDDEPPARGVDWLERPTAGRFDGRVPMDRAAAAAAERHSRAGRRRVR